MRSWGLVFKPRGLAWASDLGGDRCERSFGLRTYWTSLASRLKNPRALCLRLGLFPFAGVGMRRLGPRARRAQPLFPFNHRRKTR